LDLIKVKPILLHYEIYDRPVYKPIQQTALTKRIKMPIIKTVKMLVAGAKQQVNSVRPANAHNRQQAGDANLIDIRDIREIQSSGRIEGAFYAPRGMLELWADPSSPYHKEIFSTEREPILFCASSWRSALAAKTVQDMGISNILDMDGGFTAWKTASPPNHAR
jgi:rhodanese-related sulfurtransferase